jgi:lipopolysaccharide transport system permease protein
MATDGSGSSGPGAFERARRDVREGLALWRVAAALAQEDIGDQHRRTVLGPLWLLFNYLAFAGTFIFVFQRGDAAGLNYAAYVAIGLLVWFYIMEALTLAVSLFVREESFIKGTRLPLTTFVMRLCLQSLIRAAYALAGCVAILFLAGVTPTVMWLWSLAGVLAILAATPASVLLVAFLGAYVPDSQFVVANIMRIGMFLTPVFWSYDAAGGIQHIFYYWNPFTYFIEIVRAPIVMGTVPLPAFAFCLGVTAGCWILGAFVLGRLRNDVIFVL